MRHRFLFPIILGIASLLFPVSDSGAKELFGTDLDANCDPNGIVAAVKANFQKKRFWTDQYDKILESLERGKELSAILNSQYKESLTNKEIDRNEVLGLIKATSESTSKLEKCLDFVKVRLKYFN